MLEPSMSCEECLDRRAFLASAAAAAVLLTGCGDSGPGSITDPTNRVTITVSNFADLAVTGKLVAIDGQRVAKRTGASSFAAFSRACTHEGTQVQVVNAGVRLHCPNHGSEFDANGAVLVGPASRSLVALSTSYDPQTDILTIG
jgi:cytochrome b6-f complex iron-sulfur subunit